MSWEVGWLYIPFLFYYTQGVLMTLHTWRDNANSKLKCPWKDMRFAIFKKPGTYSNSNWHIWEFLGFLLNRTFCGNGGTRQGERRGPKQFFQRSWWFSGLSPNNSSILLHFNKDLCQHQLISWASRNKSISNLATLKSDNTIPFIGAWMNGLFNLPLYIISIWTLFFSHLLSWFLFSFFSSTKYITVFTLLYAAQSHRDTGRGSCGTRSLLCVILKLEDHYWIGIPNKNSDLSQTLYT